MADRPIIFSTPMIRALLDGRKTMTRRVMKPQPEIDGSGNLLCGGWNYGQLMTGEPQWRNPAFLKKHLRYAPGTRLWVRERAHIDGDQADYAADCDSKRDLRGFGYRPSIHMPRWASRLTLIIESVKVERLQNISDEDAQAEGARPAFSRPIEDWPVSSVPSYRWGFEELWNSIHGPDAWDANPWVSAISFRVVKANIDEMKGETNDA